MTGSKQWWLSTTLQGSIISVLVLGATIFKLEIGTEELTQLVVGVFGLIGIVMTIYGRIKATKVIE